MYQALYGDYRTFIRPLDMFLSEVDHIKYPQVKQKYRFEVYIPTDSKKTSDTIEKQLPDKSYEEIHDTNPVKKSDKVVKTKQQILLDILDADNYKEKLEMLNENKSELDFQMISNIAVSMDFVLSSESLDDQIEEICHCMQTHVRFEDSRLRQ